LSVSDDQNTLYVIVYIVYEFVKYAFRAEGDMLVGLLISIRPK
jgi:hypothetical protein